MRVFDYIHNRIPRDKAKLKETREWDELKEITNSEEIPDMRTIASILITNDRKGHVLELQYSLSNEYKGWWAGYRTVTILEEVNTKELNSEIPRIILEKLYSKRRGHEIMYGVHGIFYSPIRYIYTHHIETKDEKVSEDYYLLPIKVSLSDTRFVIMEREYDLTTFTRDGYRVLNVIDLLEYFDKLHEDERYIKPSIATLKLYLRKGI